jgi:chromate transporter
MNLFALFAQFFKIGLFSIGGGYATLPFLYELANREAWLSVEKIGNMLAVAQSLPGAVGMNLAVYTGFQGGGIPGGLIAALGLASPSIITIIIVARMLNAFRESPVVASFFSGLRPAGAGLLSSAALGVLTAVLFNSAAGTWLAVLRWRECALFAAVFLLIRLLKQHPVVYIALAGLAGVVLGL